MIQFVNSIEVDITSARKAKLLGFKSRSATVTVVTDGWYVCKRGQLNVDEVLADI